MREADGHIERLIVTVAEQQKRIEALEAALKLSNEALDQMLIWMPSGFAPQSQADAMRLAYEARKVIARAALAPEKVKPVMAASEKAAEVVSGWSDAKKDYAGRAVPSTLAEGQDK